MSTTAMILAAGRGERMRPLTDERPKPLLEVAGRSLIATHLERLARAGFTDVVINLWWLGAQIREAVGDGSRWGLAVRFSEEQPEVLETGGGIRQALPLLGSEPFLVINGDIWTDVDLQSIVLATGDLAQLVLVPNPEHHPQGDFALVSGRVRRMGEPRWTYSGVGVYHPDFFVARPPGRAALAPWLQEAMDQNRVGGQLHHGQWSDVGTPQRLAELNRPAASASGQKYTTPQGFSAIRDGIKPRPGGAADDKRGLLGKPAWLRSKLAVGAGYDFVRSTVQRHGLATVCQEAKCPNIGECWNAGTATLMLMGSVCTRACRFCSVDTGNPRGWLDAREPQHAAESVALMRLKYVVLTSVDRDDLADGGAAHYAACIRAIKERSPDTAIEALTPDFAGSEAAVECVIDAGLEVFAQNIETVRRLTHPVRDPRASYECTLAMLRHAKQYRPAVLTKSSLMLGLGERTEEVLECMDDLRAAGVDLLTLGQYLRPTANHLPVERYVSPEEFGQLRQQALDRGFRECVAGPMVRSSYRAEQALAGNNAGVQLPASGAG